MSKNTLLHQKMKLIAVIPTRMKKNSKKTRNKTKKKRSKLE